MLVKFGTKSGFDRVMENPITIIFPGARRVAVNNGDINHIFVNDQLMPFEEAVRRAGEAMEFFAGNEMEQIFKALGIENLKSTIQARIATLVKRKVFAKLGKKGNYFYKYIGESTNKTLQESIFGS